jgi:hypothetical protein
MTRPLRPATVRYALGLLTSVAAVGLVGCSNPAAGFSAPGIAANPAPAGTAGDSAPAAPAGPAEPKTRAGARAALVRYERLYLAGRFVAAWDLLTPAVKQEISRNLWVGVHDNCPSAKAGRARIRAVTIFGDTAIVTETHPGVPAKRGRNAVVLNYADAHWGYSPGDPGIYQHGSVAANVAAAKAAGFCTGWKDF